MKSKYRILVLCVVILGWLCSPVFAGGIIETIDSNGTWTGALTVEKGSHVNVSIGDYSATTDMTLTLQRKLVGDSTWGRDVDTWAVTGISEDEECITAYPEPEDCQYRIGCDAPADYTSGNCTVRLGGGRK